MNIFMAILTIFIIYFFGINGGPNEKRLLRHLFNTSREESHNILERPVINESQPVEVKINFILVQLIDVDEKKEIIEINMWFNMKWSDYHFNWNPALFNGIRKLNIPSEKVWKPDILLHNSADQNFIVTYPVQVVVQNTGIVLWDPPGLFKATCNIDIGWFPFDQQFCQLRFGSWTYSGHEIDLRIKCLNEDELFNHNNCSNHGFINLEYYKQSTEFSLIRTSVVRIQSYYDMESYISIHVNIIISRKPLYYIWNLVIPCVLISIMSVLVFLLPPDSGEKISLGVTVLLAMTMFLILVADKLPQSSTSIPFICMYFLSTIIFCSMSLFFTVIVLHLHHQSSTLQPMSSWIKYYINNFLAKFLFMKMASKEICEKQNLLQDNVEFREIQDNFNIVERSSKETMIICEEVKKITKKFEEDETKELMERDWKFAARVIDRFCLIFFSLFSFISVIVIISKINIFNT